MQLNQGVKPFPLTDILEKLIQQRKSQRKPGLEAQGRWILTGTGLGIWKGPDIHKSKSDL